MGENGVNGFSGDALDEIFPNAVVVRGNTVPATFILTDEGTPIDITDYELYLSFSLALECADGTPPELESLIPVADAVNGVFSGFVADDDTFELAMGTIFVSVKYIDADGQTFITDMARYNVVNCINPKRA